MLLLHYLLIFYTLLIFFTEFTDNKRVHKIARMDRLIQCDHSGNNLCPLLEANIENPPHKNFILNFKIQLKRDCKENLKMVFHVTRCASKEALDTCVPFTVLRPLDNCALLAMENTAWSNLTSNIHPPLKCPVKAGIYQMINGTVDIELFNFFPIDSYYWKVKVDLIESGDYVSYCSELYAVKYFS